MMGDILNKTSKNDSINEIIKKLEKDSKNLKTIEEFVDFSFSFKFNDITVTPIQRRVEIIQLLKILKKKDPKIIGEIGTAKGGTLFLLCNIINKNSKIVSVDFPEGPFGGKDYQKWKIPFYQSFAKKNQKLELIIGNSHLSETFDKVKESLADEKFDFLLIDGDHTYNGVKQDFNMYKELVKNNGIIAFHDVNPGPEEYVGGVPKFWNEVSKEHIYTDIIDKTNFHSYGIGLLLNQTKKEITHDDTLEIFYQREKTKLFNFEKKYDEEINNIRKNALGVLFYEYSQRKDLQEKYPEARTGELKGILKWIIGYGIKERSDVFREYEKSFKNILKKSISAETTLIDKDNEIKRTQEQLGIKDNEIKKISNIPLGVLFYEYSQRKDLQEKYPEARTGELKGILKWIIEYGIKERSDVFREYEKSFKNILKKSISAETTLIDKDNEIKRTQEQLGIKDNEIKRTQEQLGIKDNEIKKISNIPLGVLFYEYSQRKDLQEKYPEARTGELKGILKWIIEYGIKERSDVFREYEKSFKNILKKSISAETTLIDKDNEIKRTQEQLGIKDNEIKRTQEQLGIKDNEIKRTQEQLGIKDNEIKRTQEQLGIKDNEIKRTQEQLGIKDNEIKRTQEQLGIKDNEIKRTQEQLGIKDNEIKRTQEQLGIKDNEIKRTQEQLGIKDNEIKRTQEQLGIKDNEIKKISNIPLGALFYEYSQRKDLQEKYPEARTGELKGILKWIIEYGIKERSDVFREYENEITTTYEKLQYMEESIDALEKSKIFKILRKFDSIKSKKEENLDKTNLVYNIDGDETNKQMKKDFMIIRGWCFHKKLKIKNIYLKHKEEKKKITNFGIPRFDVFNVYMHPNSINSGFWVTYGKNEGIEPKNLSLEIIYKNNQIQNVKIFQRKNK